MRIKQVI